MGDLTPYFLRTFCVLFDPVLFAGDLHDPGDPKARDQKNSLEEFIFPSKIYGTVWQRPPLPEPKPNSMRCVDWSTIRVSC